MTGLLARETILIFFFSCATFISPFSSSTFLIEHGSVTGRAREIWYANFLPSSSVHCFYQGIPIGILHGQTRVLNRHNTEHFPIRFQRRDSNEQKSTAKPDISSFTTSSTNSDKYQIDRMEKEVLASTQSKLDWKYVQDALFGKGHDNSQPNDATTAFTIDDDNQNFRKDHTFIFSSIEISLASSIVFATICFLILHQPTVFVLVFGSVFLLSNGNPLQEENAIGAFFRIVGRFTLRVLYSAAPKAQTVMRVLLTDDSNHGQTDQQIRFLQAKITELEEENRTLRQRVAVRERKSILARHTMEELRALARREGIPVSGTKDQLLSRLVDKGVFNIDFF